MNLNNKDLKSVNKPARYVGAEVNQILKDKKRVDTNIVLCYPNVYEKAMSSNIFNVLYNNINSIKNIYCKRCFASALDFEKLLRDKKQAIYSLEDFEDIDKNDKIIFVIEDELEYTNFLNILNLANIPIYHSERSDTDPEIIVLSCNKINVYPIHDFIDKVFDDVNLLLRYINNDVKIDINYDLSGAIIPSIKIDNSSIIIDLNVIEEKNVISYIEKCIKTRGINKVSFLSSEELDEYKFCELIYNIKANIKDVIISTKNIDFSRFSKATLNVILPCIEKSSISFNVVSCSQKFCDKHLGIEKSELLEKIDTAFKNNRNSIKLMFKIGLEDETYEDIDNIFEVAAEIVNMYSKIRAKDKLSIILEIDNYIPTYRNIKDFGINTVNKLETKIRYIKQKNIDSTIKVELEDIDRYITKVMLKNGGNDMSRIISAAYINGARFDMDKLKYNKNAWDKAFYDNINLSTK